MTTVYAITVLAAWGFEAQAQADSTRYVKRLPDCSISVSSSQQAETERPWRVELCANVGDIRIELAIHPLDSIELIALVGEIERRLGGKREGSDAPDDDGVVVS